MVGLISAHYRGFIDTILQRLFVEIWQSFPGLIFVLFLVSIVGSSVLMLIITIGFLFAVGNSRVIRGATLTIEQNLFIEAARGMGASDLRIMLQHVLPSLVPIIIVTASINIGFAILFESSLSFLGFGVQPPVPSWGRMLQDAQREMLYHPYLAIAPGLAIALTVYSLNMLGDALRDILDPRLRGST